MDVGPFYFRHRQYKGVRPEPVSLVGVVAATALAGVVGAATGTPALLGVTPVGAAIYLVVGVGLPQLSLGRRAGDAARLGLGALTVAPAPVTTAP